MDLANKFRPKNLADIIAQDDIKGVFEKFITAKKIPHSLFFGSAGCGKTTFARVIANEMNYEFFEFDGANLKIDDIRKIIAKFDGSLYKPLIFIDEFHRLSKTQQETLLIPMEAYKCIIMGATTENPKFVISSAIRSRIMIFEFKALTHENLQILLNSICAKLKFKISKEAANYLISSSCGDARSMLNLLDYALMIDDDISLRTLKILRSQSQSEGANSDDTHYNLTSALIKSMRGSDIDASIYYLARLINGGEEPTFIARRMVIFASEDIGNANPNALNLAVSAMQAVSKIGYPEARIILAQCAVYLASSPKSNSSYEAINNALAFVRSKEALQIPKYLLNTDKAHEDYLYPHDFGGWVNQAYTSEPVEFYHSKEIGFESTLTQWHSKIINKKQ